LNTNPFIEVFEMMEIWADEMDINEEQISHVRELGRGINHEALRASIRLTKTFTVQWMYTLEEISVMNRATSISNHDVKRCPDYYIKRWQT